MIRTASKKFAGVVNTPQGIIKGFNLNNAHGGKIGVFSGKMNLTDSWKKTKSVPICIKDDGNLIERAKGQQIY